MSIKTVFFLGSLAAVLVACGKPNEADHQALVEDKSDAKHETNGHHADHDDHDGDHSDDTSYAVHVEHGDHKEEYDHTVLEAHEHGSAEASVVVEGNTIEIEIFAPLANFGFAESGDAVPSSSEFTDMLRRSQEPVVATIDGECVRQVKGTVTEIEGHAEGQITISSFCPRMPAKLEFALLKTFEDGFEELDVILVSDHGQKSVELTPTQRIMELH